MAKNKPFSKKPIHTTYSLAVGCYCKELNTLGFTCDWCVQGIVESKNQLVRENNELRKNGCNYN